MGDSEASFGLWLKRRRRVLDLTQEQLADCVGCSVVTIRKFESDERHPSTQLVERLADCLGIPREDRAAFESLARGRPTKRDIPAVDAAFAAPELEPAFRTPTNISAPLTPLIGREHEIEVLRGRLRRGGTRLLTLLGPAGIGKTRLSLELAARLLGDYADGVFFIELAPLRNPEQILPAVAQTLGVKQSGGQNLLEQLKAHLRDKHMLLVLDNFEQVSAGAPLLTELLIRCPKLMMLVTSRVTLHVRGEHQFPLDPLPLPDVARAGTLGQVVDMPAIRLFAERAQGVSPGFAITADNAGTIAEICRRLEGLPLAIELAAARVRILPLRALLARLSTRLDVLTGGQRDLPARQATLRRAIDWSYELLDADEQRLFRRMGVFVGGCTLEAVEAVRGSASDKPGESPIRDVLDAMSALADKTLIRRLDTPAGDARFVMLETMREYALEQLKSNAEEPTLRRQHADYYLELALRAEAELAGQQQVLWLNRLDEEHNNLRAALEWAIMHRELATALGIGGALWRFWATGSYLAEGRALLAQMLAVAGPLRSSRGGLKVLYGAGVLADAQRDYVAAEGLFSESLRISEAMGNRWGISNSLNNLGVIKLRQGDYVAARALYEESLALLRELAIRKALPCSSRISEMSRWNRETIWRPTRSTTKA